MPRIFHLTRKLHSAILCDMSTKPALTPKAAAHLANMIERAERRGAILADLVHVCETLSKKLARDMMDGPFHPESRHDTARAFDVVTRSLRLTLAMEDRVDRQLFALHNGELPVAPARRKEAGGGASAPAVSAEAQPEPARSAGSESDREAPDSERCESERESLIEREFEVFRVSGDVDADIDAIRERLGRLPPSPEVGRADSRRQAASRVGDGRGAGSLGDTCENDSREHRDIPHPALARRPESALPTSGERRFQILQARISTSPPIDQRSLLPDAAPTIVAPSEGC